MSEVNTNVEVTNWTNPPADWKEVIATNMELKAFAASLNVRLDEQQRLIDSWKSEVEKLTIDNHILREELARERAPKQDVR